MNIIEITSMQNSILKEYNKLKKSSNYRQKCRKIALEGPNLLHEAIKTGLIPEIVFYTQEYYNSENRSFLDTLPGPVEQAVLPQKLFAKIADTENPQAIAAIVHFNPEDKAGKISDIPGLILILNRLQDPGNMGSIIRTAAAAGVDVVFYTRGSVDPYSPKVLRSTAGSIFHLPVLKVEKPLEMIRELKKNGFSVAAAAPHQGVNLWEADFDHKTALIVGNEAGGLDKSLLDAVDLTVTIPLAEPVESLNAAVAAALILYEVIRQRRP